MCSGEWHGCSPFTPFQIDILLVRNVALEQAIEHLVEMGLANPQFQCPGFFVLVKGSD